MVYWYYKKRRNQHKQICVFGLFEFLFIYQAEQKEEKKEQRGEILSHCHKTVIIVKLTQDGINQAGINHQQRQWGPGITITTLPKKLASFKTRFSIGKPGEELRKQTPLLEYSLLIRKDVDWDNLDQIWGEDSVNNLEEKNNKTSSSPNEEMNLKK